MDERDRRIYGSGWWKCSALALHDSKGFVTTVTTHWGRNWTKSGTREVALDFLHFTGSASSDKTAH